MASNPSLPAAWPEQRIYIGRLNQSGADKLINDILADQPPTSFHFVLGRIIETLREENHVLAFKDDATIPQLAWAGRNIMELRILSRFVCQSKANLDRFENDLLTAGTATLQSLVRLVDDLAEEVNGKSSPEEMYRRVGFSQSARQEAGLGNDGPLMARACARKVNPELEKEYLAFSSVTSPLIHPSAISVLKTVNLEGYRQVLVPLGLVNATRVIQEAREHISNHGYKPEK